jgi:hypothetical protein
MASVSGAQNKSVRGDWGEGKRVTKTRRSEEGTNPCALVGPSPSPVGVARGMNHRWALAAAIAGVGRACLVCDKWKLYK